MSSPPKVVAGICKHWCWSRGILFDDSIAKICFTKSILIYTCVDIASTDTFSNILQGWDFVPETFAYYSICFSSCLENLLVTKQPCQLGWINATAKTLLALYSSRSMAAPRKVNCPNWTAPEPVNAHRPDFLTRSITCILYEYLVLSPKPSKCWG